MHLKPRSDMRVVKKEEKEAQLKAFIAQDLESRANSGHDVANTYLVIARSLESPVIRAIASLAPELSRAGVVIKMILSGIDTPVPQAKAHPAAQSANTITLDARVACDPRLFDLHEQLVLSNDCSWIGDVMRREPAKRDAYENFCPACVSTARWAQLAFKRIWATTKPVAAIQLTTVEPTPDDEKFASFTAATADSDNNGVTFGTRH